MVRPINGTHPEHWEDRRPVSLPSQTTMRGGRAFVERVQVICFGTLPKPTRVARSAQLTVCRFRNSRSSAVGIELCPKAGQIPVVPSTAPSEGADFCCHKGVTCHSLLLRGISTGKSAYGNCRDCSRMTGNPEVIHASVGLVPTNTLTRQVKSC
jgi:hypothetical protein